MLQEMYWILDLLREICHNKGKNLTALPYEVRGADVHWGVS